MLALSQPFDRVFALLGLAIVDDIGGLIVDYTMSPGAFYCHVLSLLERAVKSEKEWVRMRDDLAQALELTNY